MDKSAMESPNPFNYLDPVVPGQGIFIGRTRELADSVQWLQNHVCVGIVGGRRLGRTSLLRHIAYKLEQAQSAIKSVEVDCGNPLIGLEDANETGLYEKLLMQVRARLGVPAEQLPIATQDGRIVDNICAFGNTLKWWASYCQPVGSKKRTDQPMRFVFMLDRFERLVRNKQLSARFWSGLRGLVDTDPEKTVCYCSVVPRPLESTDWPNYDPDYSQFLDKTEMVPLNLLTQHDHAAGTNEDEAKALLRYYPLQGHLHFSDGLIDWLIEVLAGPHPQLLQLAGWCAFEALKGEECSPRTKEARIASIVREFTSRAESVSWMAIWQSLWESSRLDPAYFQRYLLLLSVYQDKECTAIGRLRRAGVILPHMDADGKLHPLSLAFRNFVIKQVRDQAGLLSALPVVIDDKDEKAAWVYDSHWELHQIAKEQQQYDMLKYLVEKQPFPVSKDTLARVINPAPPESAQPSSKEIKPSHDEIRVVDRRLTEIRAQLRDWGHEDIIQAALKNNVKFIPISPPS